MKRPELTPRPFSIDSREHARTGLSRLAEVAPEHVELSDDYQRYWGAQLTARELDVGRLMLSGCSSKEIARKLQTSVETVKVHKKTSTAR